MRFQDPIAAELHEYSMPIRIAEPTEINSRYPSLLGRGVSAFAKPAGFPDGIASSAPALTLVNGRNRRWRVIEARRLCLWD